MLGADHASTRDSGLTSGSEVALDHATHAFGLATPAGVVSTTGLGGRTLGGGHGYLPRRHELSIDNLLSVDLVLADRSFVRASDAQNEELFWAIRGGGGNFGVVTSFTFRLHAVRSVIAGVTLWDADRAGDVLRWSREFLPQTPIDLNGFFMIFTVPPGPPFPPELHLKNMAGVVWCSLANPEEQDGAIEAIVQHGSRLPTMLSWMQLYPVDGAAHRVGRNDTAWSYRDAVWSGLIEGFDPDPANAEPIRRWCLGFWDALQPHSMGAGYVNFIMDEPSNGVRTAYRENYDRLSRIKRSYDPDNVFHLNQNIKPAS